MKKLVRLTEQDLHKIINESVNSILEAKYAWREYDDGIHEYDIENGGWPRDNNFENKPEKDIRLANEYGKGTGSGNEWMQNTKGLYNELDFFAKDDPIIRRHYVDTGRISLDRPEEDLRLTNKNLRRKQAAADRRWKKSADTRPLYGKKSPNNYIP